MSSEEESQTSHVDVTSDITTYQPIARIASVNYVGGDVFGVIPSDLFQSPRSYIEISRQGVPGRWVKSVVDTTGLIEPFRIALDIGADGLCRVYQQKALGQKASESVLDIIRVLHQAFETWESKELAVCWLNSPVEALMGEKPVNLCDTFEGRRWISSVLGKIEQGEFS